MSKVQTARDLVAFKSYTPTGTTDTRLTRKLTLDQEWVFSATGGNQFMIKFDKNFFKKHLFTHSKKTDEVSKIAYYLWETAGKPPGKDEEFWLQAELVKLNDKLTKALKHRAEGSVCTCGHMLADHPCSACNHGRARHFTGSGNRCNCKEPAPPDGGGPCGCLGTAAVTFGCKKAGCTCAAFTPTTGAYGAQRAGSGKGPDNPLAGAQTTRNTCLILDRIPMEKFKEVVVKAFETVETPGFTWADGTEEHVDWNFNIDKCVIQADLSQDPSAWATYKGVQVTAKKINSTPLGTGSGKQYVYQVFHQSGTIA
jgi:hypothetical protein